MTSMGDGVPRRRALTVRQMDHGASTVIVLRHRWWANLRWRVKRWRQG